MNAKVSNLIGIGTLISFAFFAWAGPARAVDPDLIDVVQIVDPQPFIIHENILPGDSFLHPVTVKNLTGTPQDIVMNLDIDLSEGRVSLVPFELEERIFVKMKRLGTDTFLILPGPGGDTEATLQELDDTFINLGTIGALATEEYEVSFVFDPNAGNEYQNTKVYFNVVIGLEILEARGSLQIWKENDSVGDEAPGNEVEYRITVTALHGDVDDVTVTDLPPEGFEYIAGSGEGAPFVHEYASPGVWNLGDMEEGETRTLTYRTRISAAQDDGLYRDLAYARGTTGDGVPVLAADPANPHPSVDPTNPSGDSFVGTRVAVAVNAVPTVVVEEDNENKRVEKIKKQIQYVLGASTLPMTGADARILMLAVAGIIVGVGAILLARRRRSVLPVLLLLCGSMFFSSSPVQAANLSIKIEVPETQVESPNFRIGFVALDIVGRPITVECQVQGPSDALFATFATPVSGAVGGNSGDCVVSAAVMPTDGEYQFQVVATASGGEGADESVTAGPVTVALHSVIPGTPYDYDRDDASCMNNIMFKTAADGDKTVKVELYRSLATSFTADASTFVAEQMIGSDVSGAFAIPAPGCSNDYFYALRAVEIHGNGSGFVGDKDVNVDTNTVTRNRTTTVTLPGATGALAVVGADGAAGEAAAGEVQGAETVAEEGSRETALPAGSVLGDGDEQEIGLFDQMKDWITSHPWWSALALLGLILLSSYFGIRSRKKSDEILP
jgi:LPXTG-motif cell wall-anchored protein